MESTTLINSKIDHKKAESELRGTTLRVYWELFRKNRPLGVREIQRSLKLSSPSTSLYHLEKIRELGVAEKNRHGQYFISSEIKI